MSSMSSDLIKYIRKEYSDLELIRISKILSAICQKVYAKSNSNPVFIIVSIVEIVEESISIKDVSEAIGFLAYIHRGKFVDHLFKGDNVNSPPPPIIDLGTNIKNNLLRRKEFIKDLEYCKDDEYYCLIPHNINYSNIINIICLMTGYLDGNKMLMIICQSDYTASFYDGFRKKDNIFASKNNKQNLILYLKCIHEYGPINSARLATLLRCGSKRTMRDYKTKINQEFKFHGFNITNKKPNQKRILYR